MGRFSCGAWPEIGSEGNNKGSLAGAFEEALALAYHPIRLP
jgi:hypothetical protein